MKLSMDFRGQDDAFEGDRTLLLRALPAGARVTHAAVTLTPAAASEREISFAAGGESWGATQSGNDTPAPVVDLHKRRTLLAVRAARVGGGAASVQIDMGGTWAGIASDGTFMAPDKTLLTLPLEADMEWHTLPPLTSEKLKLSALFVGVEFEAADAVDPEGQVSIEAVRVRAVPLNVNLRLGTLAPFWTHLGEMTTVQTTPDFSALLNLFLTDLTPDGGYYAIPLTLHSDGIAAFDVRVSLDYVMEQTVLPPHLKEINVPFNFSTLPGVDEALMTVRLPLGATPLSATAEIRGEFEGTRIARGTLGHEPPSIPMELSPACSLAQPLRSEVEIALTGLDVHLGNTQPGISGMSFALQADDDGKPSGVALITAEVRVDKPLPGQSAWGSAALPAPFRLLAGVRYWLVLHSLSSRAFWNVTEDASAEPTLQCSRDGGLAWRAAAAPGTAAQIAARYRLRHTPPRYSVPLTLEIGDGETAQRRRFDEFAALGRIAFSFDFSGTLGDYLRESAPLVTCGIDDLLFNGDFSQPPLAPDASGQATIGGVPDGWTLARGSVRREQLIAAGPVVLALNAETVTKGVLRPATLAQELAVRAGCAYQLRFYYAAAFGAAARWLLRWLDADGADLGEDGAALLPADGGLSDVPHTNLLPYEARLIAPSGAALAELAFEVDAPDDGGSVFAVMVEALAHLLLAGASFTPTDEALTNTHFWVIEPTAGQELPTLVGWTLENGTTWRDPATQALIIQAGAQPATLTQVAHVTAGERCHLRLEGQAGGADAALELYWLDADLQPIGQPERVSIGVYAFGAHVWSGNAPATASAAAVQVVLAPGAELLLNSIHLMREQEQTAALRFLAESPGSLKVSDVRVRYDLPAPPPALLPLDPRAPLPISGDAEAQGLTPGALRGQGLTPGALRPQGLTPGALRGQALTPGALRGARFAGASAVSTAAAVVARPSAFADRPVDIVSGIGARFAEALRDLPQPVTTIRELAALDTAAPMPRGSRERLVELRAAAEMILDISIDLSAFSALAGASLEALLARPAADIARQSGQPAASVEHLLRKLRALRFLLQNDAFRALNLSDLA